MTSTCGLRMPLSVRCVEFGAALATRDVDRGDDEVESGEQVVVVVERAVGADLELAAVEQAEALRPASRAVPCRPPPLPRTGR